MVPLGALHDPSTDRQKVKSSWAQPLVGSCNWSVTRRICHKSNRLAVTFSAPSERCSEGNHRHRRDAPFQPKEQEIKKTERPLAPRQEPPPIPHHPRGVHDIATQAAPAHASMTASEVNRRLLPDHKREPGQPPRSSRSSRSFNTRLTPRQGHTYLAVLRLTIRLMLLNQAHTRRKDPRKR